METLIETKEGTRRGGAPGCDVPGAHPISSRKRGAHLSPSVLRAAIERRYFARVLQKKQLWASYCKMTADGKFSWVDVQVLKRWAWCERRSEHLISAVSGDFTYAYSTSVTVIELGCAEIEEEVRRRCLTYGATLERGEPGAGLMHYARRGAA